VVFVRKHENGSLRSRLSEVLVLVLLRVGKSVTFLENRDLVLLVVFGVGQNQSDSSSRDISETCMEADEVAADEEVDAEGDLGETGLL